MTDRGPGASFVHLHVHSHFSFLDGVSSPEELVRAAAAAGMGALALTDHANVSGAVRFARAARAAGIKPIQGAEVTTRDGHHLVLLAADEEGYAHLCALLTAAHLANPRGAPRSAWSDLERHREGLFVLSGCRQGQIPSLILRREYEKARAAARRCRDLWGRRFFLELESTLLPGDRFLHRRLQELGRTLDIPLVAAHNVHYARRRDFPTHDLACCLRLNLTLEEVHPGRPLNDENHLADPRTMARRFADCPAALENAAAIAAACRPALPEKVPPPSFPVPDGESPDAFLRELVQQGALRRYGRLTVPIRERLERELAVIAQLGFASYFLIAWDVVCHARAQGIRCSGRGSAGASAVAYCLQLTEVDPIRRQLIFERFLSPERAERPDIDLDFDARRRDEVSAYVYRRYGEDRVAGVAVYSTFQARSAVRAVGQVLGYAPEELDDLAKTLPPMPADGILPALARLPELRRGPWRQERYRRLFAACARVAGLPRFLGTHLGGLIVSPAPVRRFTPLQLAAKGTRIGQFDRDDAEGLGLMKLDLLCLRTLGVLEDAAREITRQDPDFAYDRLPPDDPDSYRLLHRGRTVGIFQLESPAQRTLQGRLKAQNPEDLVASVALIRPGPIKGNMVDPFVARRRGEEPVSYPHPALAPILEKTYGVVLFQEQVIAIATELAGFSPGEADQLRRLMTHARSHREMQELGRTFLRRCAQRGVAEAKAREVFACMEGYAGYGFCEAHAAAFAALSYQSAYLSAHHPAHFFAALLNNQPMGYYSPATLVNEARLRGIEFLPVDINESGETFAVEGNAIRIPLSRVRDLGPSQLTALLEARRAGPFASLADFVRRVRLERDPLENLVLVGAFDSLQPHRLALLHRLPFLLADPDQRTLPLVPAELADLSPEEKLLQEYRVLGFGCQAHYMTLYRKALAAAGYITSRQLCDLPEGHPVKLAGLPIRPHRPPTRSGRTVVFLSLEDETGLADVTIFEGVYQRFGHLLFGPQAGPLLVAGQVHRRGGLASVVAERLEAWPPPKEARTPAPPPGRS
jgi:error-prone DNA polymerase